MSATQAVEYRMYLDYVILHPTLDPAEITRNMGCAPSKAISRGTPRGHAKVPAKYNVWSLRSQLSEENADVGGLWLELSSLLMPKVDYLRDLQGPEKSLYVVVHMITNLPTLVLPIGMSEFSARSRSEIVIEPYTP